MNIQPYNPIKKARLLEIFQSFQDIKIAVIGDFCLDVYWHLDMKASELSIETNKTTQPVRKQNYFLGGAGNLAANLHALKVGKIHSFGIVGDDPFGHKLLSLLDKISDSTDLLKCDSEAWQTLAYCKPYIGNEEQQRLDMGNFNKLPDSFAELLINSLEDKIGLFNLIVINQQVAAGIHSRFLQKKLDELIKRYQDTRFIFDGRHLQNVYDKVWLKVNDHEALKLAGMGKNRQNNISLQEVSEAIEIIYKKKNRPVVVTGGTQGCLACSSEGIVKVAGIPIDGKIDPVGAGDSFLAGMAAALAGGANLEEAVQIANFAAAVTITKIGQTGTASQEEILGIFPG